MTVTTAELKKLIVERLLIDEPFAVVLLRSGYSGVIVPESLRIGNGLLTIEIGRAGENPIQDLSVGALGFSETLHFPVVGYFKVTVPWSAVIGLFPGDRRWFIGFEERQAVETTSAEETPPAKTPSPPRRLQLVPSGGKIE